MIKKLILAASVGTALFALPVSAAQLVLFNVDDPGVGFNDPTPATPVGGNAGTTLGEQRLIAYDRALTLWGSVLKSNVPVIVQGSFARLTCTAAGGTLAQAGAISVFSDFANAPLAGHWYGGAIADAIAGEDLDPGYADIVANFNGAVGQADCIPGPGFYYGLDNAPPPGAIDFLNTFMHEVAHGLGFQNFVDETDGTLLVDVPDVYTANTRDLDLNKKWDVMTTDERLFSGVNTGRVVWDGPKVTAGSAGVLGPYEGLRVSGKLSRELDFGTASFGAPPSPSMKVGSIVAAIDNDGTPNPSDACGPLINNVRGKVVLADRGSCGFAVKAANAQAAGAVALLIANNAPGAGAIGLGGADPTLTITTLGISFEDGADIRAALPGVSAQFFSDKTRRAGASEGFVRLYAPGVVQPGSSISHFDTVATPNLLMEPAITPTLMASRNLDLTPALMFDIGWKAEPVALGQCVSTVPGALANGALVLPAVEDCLATGTPRSYGVCVAKLARDYEAAGLIDRKQRVSLTACGVADATSRAK
ncbi:PA domain-containing protein [Nevskia ramosa]|uniref:PA domain-containing protein n=1 Tax=Nevskia ramosa TaxID=64002 RepID=UPI0023545876